MFLGRETCFFAWILHDSTPQSLDISCQDQGKEVSSAPKIVQQKEVSSAPKDSSAEGQSGSGFMLKSVR